MNYNNVKYEASYGTSKQLIVSDLPEIAFSGRSNVGKSSLINKIFNRKNLARVSSMPGKTTTVNFFRADNVRFSDLPGYGYAKRSDAEKKRWADLMEGYFQSKRNIKLVVQLLTKCDKLGKSEREKRREEIKSELAFAGDCKTIEFSAGTGEGCGEVKTAIEEAVR